MAEAGLDAAIRLELELATPIRSTAAGTASWYVDYLQASLNGFWGDYLAGRTAASTSG